MRHLNTLNIPVVTAMTLNRFCYLLLFSAATGSFFTSNPLVMWFVLINVLTMAIYGADKMAAQKGIRRVREATLLRLGVKATGLAPFWVNNFFAIKRKSSPLKPTLC